jgi:hypothetical protein
MRTSLRREIIKDGSTNPAVKQVAGEANKLNSLADAGAAKRRK